MDYGSDTDHSNMAANIQPTTHHWMLRQMEYRPSDLNCFQIRRPIFHLPQHSLLHSRIDIDHLRTFLGQQIIVGISKYRVEMNIYVLGIITPIGVVSILILMTNLKVDIHNHLMKYIPCFRVYTMEGSDVNIHVIAKTFVSH